MYTAFASVYDQLMADVDYRSPHNTCGELFLLYIIVSVMCTVNPVCVKK